MDTLIFSFSCSFKAPENVVSNLFNIKYSYSQRATEVWQKHPHALFIEELTKENKANLLHQDCVGVVLIYANNITSMCAQEYIASSPPTLNSWDEHRPNTEIPDEAVWLKCVHNQKLFRKFVLRTFKLCCWRRECSAVSPPFSWPLWHKMGENLKAPPLTEV